MTKVIFLGKRTLAYWSLLTISIKRESKVRIRHIPSTSLK